MLNELKLVRLLNTICAVAEIEFEFISWPKLKPIIDWLIA